MASLYSFALHRAENFHRRVDNRRNVLLLCLTAEDKLFGAFTSAGFSLKDEEPGTISCLFDFADGGLRIFPLKKGRASTVYDPDFLLFGN